jgi:hypothetical protein
MIRGLAAIEHQQQPPLPQIGRRCIVDGVATPLVDT